MNKTQSDDLAQRIQEWFESQGWLPFEFQREVWQGMLQKRWGLLHASTGSGKTLASWFGALLLCQQQNQINATGLRVLWITPMRALAADTTLTLEQSALSLAPHWRVEMRTSDTTASLRAKQSKSLSQALVTTPESLSLLLANADAKSRLGQVQVVIVDEWHELMGSKRGVQVQLALARLARWQPNLVVWGMSATLANLDEALQTLCLSTTSNPILVSDSQKKEIRVDTLLPAQVERFAWAGHLGLTLAPQVAAEILSAKSSLVFVNTRSQAERWYQALLDVEPSLAGVLALHHGSLDQSVRQWVERGLKQGELRAVVCTASLDLGVDFLPVERVLQIGSAKGIARLLQRAGRAGHAPGRVSRITLVPTNSLEILEAVAAQDAVKFRAIEARDSPSAPMDVLVQHLVTVALGGGFSPDDLFSEVKTTAAYRDLTNDQWAWALSFVSKGGNALGAYPDYQRVHPDESGIWRVPDRALARRHRMSVGTITSDAMMMVRYWGARGGGSRLGQVEESFIARLKRGDCFTFAGRLLELVRVQEMTAFVKRASGTRAAVPRWMGGNMPLSSTLADAMLTRLDQWREGTLHDDKAPDWQAILPLLETQRDWSALPGTHCLLVEWWTSREGVHLFFYPFAGRHVHLGLSSLLAWRMAQQQPLTFSLAVNDYGFEMLCAQPLDVSTLVNSQLFSTDNLAGDIQASLNAGELAQRRFREIARVAGLVFQGYPGAKKTARQVQASSSLFYQVFDNHDPENELLLQAREEVLKVELDFVRLRATLNRLHSIPIVLRTLARPTPFALPLVVERLRERLSTEKLSDRVARLVRDLEKAVQ